MTVSIFFNDVTGRWHGNSSCSYILVPFLTCRSLVVLVNVEMRCELELRESVDGKVACRPARGIPAVTRVPNTDATLLLELKQYLFLGLTILLLFANKHSFPWN